MGGGSDDELVGLVALAARREEFDWGREGSSAVIALISSGILGVRMYEKGLVKRGESERRETRERERGDERRTCNPGRFPRRIDQPGTWREEKQHQRRKDEY